MTDQIKIFFFGDSICFGQCTSLHKSWVNLVSSKLGAFAADRKIRIVVQNPSVNGNTTRMALERMPFDVQVHEPDIVIVQFGLNDCNYWETDRGMQRVSPQSFEANINEIITRAFLFGAHCVIVNTNHPTCRDRDILPYSTTTYQQSNEQYNQILRNSVHKHVSNVILNDIEKIFKDYSNNQRENLMELLMPEPDLLHLNDAGNSLYVEHSFPLIKDACESILGANSDTKKD